MELELLRLQQQTKNIHFKNELHQLKQTQLA
jgi:hypothetical protein